MGLISTSSSFCRYQVKDPVPKDYHEHYAQEIRRNCFREIEENSDIERSSGWVNIMNIFDTAFPGEEFFQDTFIALSLRIDTRRIPSHILRQYCTKAEEEKKADIGKNFLSKEDRENIRDRVKFQLLRKIIPTIRTFDMIWDIHKGEILFSSLNEKIGDEFQELFKKTFDCYALPLCPYTMAQDMLTDEQKNMLEDISSESFVE
ncbi:MAG: recombination-associated protein RdgC [bacterium]